MRRVLVTGGAGFIGSHVVELLEDGGHEILVLDNFSTGRASNLSRGIRVVDADLCVPQTASDVVGRFRPEVVIHLAAQVSVRRSIENPAFDAGLNILGGIQLLKACAEYQVRRVVFGSSGGAIYGTQESIPIRETALPHPESPYALSKETLEKYGHYFSHSGGLEFVSLRLANVYGPRQDPGGEAGVVAIFLDKLTRGLRPVIFGDGSDTRDYVWVQDVAEAFVAALDGPTGAYNIGTGVETCTTDVFWHLKELMDSKCDPVFKQEIPGEVRRNALDCTLALNKLKWSHKVILSEGLKSLVRVALSNARGEPYEGAIDSTR